MSVKKPEIPFQSHYVEIDGCRMHYFDEGVGDVILFAHGIPEWSMTYAKLIKELSGNYRCIIPDHIGFGLSDKIDGVPLTPKAHAERLLQFIEQLHLENIHLVVHDFGGPIGIGALVSRPGLFRTLTISNTWLWSLAGTPVGNGLSLMQGFVGKWLYLSYGFSVKYMAKNAFANKKDFNAVREVFMYPHQTKTDRYANYQLMLEMLNSGTWYNECLVRLKQLDMPVQIVWGMKDKFFPHEDFLERWKKELPKAGIILLEESGHFPQIETPRAFAGAIKDIVGGAGNRALSFADSGQW